MAGAYEMLAADYDWMFDDDTVANGRAINLPATARLLQRISRTNRVLDAACGTGVDAAVLARRGFTVWAADGSAAMAEEAAARFRRERLAIPLLHSRWADLPTATGERLKQMEETGILRGYTLEIDREALGLEVLAFIRMSCGGQNYYRLLEYIQTLEEVRECHHLTGGDDFLLKVTTTSLADLEALIEALLPYGNPVTSLVLSSPVEHRKYAVMGKLTTVTKKRARRR